MSDAQPRPNPERRSDPAPAPSRNQRFAHPAIEPIFAAFRILPTAAQHEFHEYVAELLIGSIDADSERRRREAAAIRALREAARLLGHSPSVPEFRRLRDEHPEHGWPADGSIRAWLGGRWNDALRSAGLDTVEDGDALIARRGSKFTTLELMQAIDAFAGRLSAEDLAAVVAGDLPLLANDYEHWAHSATDGQPVRLPLSMLPFERSFGNFEGAVEAWRAWRQTGQLPAEPDHARRRKTAIYRPEAGVYGKPEVRRALAEVAERLARRPVTWPTPTSARTSSARPQRPAARAYASRHALAVSCLKIAHGLGEPPVQQINQVDDHLALAVARQVAAQQRPALVAQLRTAAKLAVEVRGMPVGVGQQLGRGHPISGARGAALLRGGGAGQRHEAQHEHPSGQGDCPQPSPTMSKDHRYVEPWF